MYRKQKFIYKEFWWGSQEERDHWEDLNVDWRLALKRILEKRDGVAWTGLIWLRIGNSC
jgi:hypothetical protein